MPRRPTLPDALLAGPFRSATARRCGLSIEQLRGPAWRRLLHDVYVAASTPDSPSLRAAAATLVLPRGGALCEKAAAWVLGVDLMGPRERVAVCVPTTSTGIRRRGLVIRRCDLSTDDLMSVAGIPVTSPVRTAFDLGRRPPLVEGVVGVDALLHAGLLNLDELAAYISARPGWRGVRLAREVCGWADPLSESPMESRLRMIPVAAGLGRPQSQVEVYDSNGFVARVDLLLDWVAFEYDGAHHRDSIAADLRRRNRLVSAGLMVLQFSATDVWSGQIRVADQLRRALGIARDPSPQLLAARAHTILRPSVHRISAPRPFADFAETGQ